MDLLPNQAIGAQLKLPMMFERNVGQTATEVRYLGRSAGLRTYFTPSEVVLATDAGNVRMHLVGANPRPRVKGVNPLPGRSNYLRGRETYRNIEQFGQIRYEEVYPWIDMIYRGGPDGLEYDFKIAAGADPGRIGLRFEGSDKVSIDRAGDLILALGKEVIRQHKPRAYQRYGGEVREVACQYFLGPDNTAALRLGAYDRGRTLVVDPVISYSTYIGGSSGWEGDVATAVTTDSSGNVYVTGRVTALDFPTSPGSYSSTGKPVSVCFGGPVWQSCSDAFVLKLNREGTSILYATYLGGSHIDKGLAIAVDSVGNAYVTGYTRSADFPVTPGAFQTTFGGGTCTVPDYRGTINVPCPDAFVTKLDPTGSSLLVSTYFGGSGDDEAIGIATDDGRSVVIAGKWRSPEDLPLKNAVQSTQEGFFVTKLDASGNSLIYLTRFSKDEAAGLAMDAAGNAYVTGTTYRADFPTTPGAISSPLRVADAFVVKFTPSGGLVYSANLGGSAIDVASSIAVDTDGNAYIAGTTGSKDFPLTAGPFGNVPLPEGDSSVTWGVSNIFVAVLSPDGTTLRFSTVLGGAGRDVASGIAVDHNGDIFLSGSTESTDFPVTQGAVRRCPASDAIWSFIAKVDPTAGQLAYSSYFAPQQGPALAADGFAGVWLAGSVHDTPYFPVTEGAIQREYYGGYAVALSKLDFSRDLEFGLTCVASTASLQGGPVAPGELVTLFGAGLGPQTPVSLQLNADGMVDTTLSNVRVWFDDVAAPLIYVQSDRISAVVPYAVNTKGNTVVQVEYGGRRTAGFDVGVTRARAGVFTVDMTGVGQGAILNWDGTVNSPSNPAVEGSIVAMWGTGMGMTNPPGVDGQLVQAPYPTSLLPARAAINGVNAQIMYAGAAPTLVSGVVQVNVRIPLGVKRTDSLPNQLVIQFGSYPYLESPPVGLSLK